MLKPSVFGSSVRHENTSSVYLAKEILKESEKTTILLQYSENVVRNNY